MARREAGFSWDRHGPYWGLVLFILAAAPLDIASESLTLNTYYPSPLGIYTNLTSTQQTLLARDGGYVGIRTGGGAPGHVLDVLGDATGIRQGYNYIGGGVGWQSYTYNAYHNAANTGWVFPDASHTAVTMEMDDAGGNPRWEVYSTRNAAKTTWVGPLLRLDGQSGNFGIGVNPAQKLDVAGNANASGNITAGGNMSAGGTVTAGGNSYAGGYFSPSQSCTSQINVAPGSSCPSTSWYATWTGGYRMPFRSWGSPAINVGCTYVSVGGATVCGGLSYSAPPVSFYCCIK